jgi:hypothetical protein
MPATDCSAARTLSWVAFKTIMSSSSSLISLNPLVRRHSPLLRGAFLMTFEVSP